MNPRRDVTFQLPGEIPTDTICVQLRIPRGAYYARQFYAAVEQMSFWFAYDGDAAHTGAKVANLWKAALRTIAACPDQTIIMPCGCGDCDCMCNQLRFHNCVLQQFDCLTQMWIDVPTDEDCVPNPAPGSGTTPPAAGACQDYTIPLQANALTIMPFVVNSGDTIQLEAVTGAGTDGTPNWYCADGEYYILGGCAGGGGFNSGDPLPTTKHMALLWKIGSNYYPINSTLFTVPGGFTNAQIWAQVNDSSLADDSGAYNIKFNYCNQQTPPIGTWCQTLNFVTSPSGFSSYTVNDGCGTPVNNSAWAGGAGWQTPGYTPTCVPSHDEAQTTIALDMGALTTITSVELKGHYYGNGSTSRALVVTLLTTPPWSGGGTNAVVDTSFPATSDFDISSGAISVSARYIQFSCYDVDPGVSVPLVFEYHTLILKGTGVNPFGASNC